MLNLNAALLVKLLQFLYWGNILSSQLCKQVIERSGINTGQLFGDYFRKMEN